MPPEATVCGRLGAGSGALAILDVGALRETEPVTSGEGRAALGEANGSLISKRPESEQPATAIATMAMAATRVEIHARDDTTDAGMRLLTRYATIREFE
jgi:hypothetical protein